MPKRKRPVADDAAKQPNGKLHKSSNDTIHLQIVTGSYERVLHGVTAAIPRRLLTSAAETKSHVEFTDSFLFAAHVSSIRALAISTPSITNGSHTQKRLLATGGADSKINIYHLATSPPAVKSVLPTESRNRSLGTLSTHDAAITALAFPPASRTKLISACAANLLGITATRTWATLSYLKAPAPKVAGRPSGDTAHHGNFGADLPMGANAIAVHPSSKLMLSVHRGERHLRLWNLVTGKKAGVLSFSPDMLKEAGEASFNGKVGWGHGEGRALAWDEKGEEFAVAFERGIAVFDLVSCFGVGM
jgi:protein MAK11